MAKHSLAAFALLVQSAVVAGAAPQSIEELVSHYGDIFQTGNRNAASHLWTSYVLESASSLAPSALETLFRGFCPISGSPLPDSPHTRYESTLTDVSGGQHTGITHHCCWPCICDLQSSVKTDTKTVHTAEGPREYRFLVIGDPCAHQEKLNSGFQDPFTGEHVTLQQEAPEVKCDAGRLKGAVFSDHGYPMIGMYFVGDGESGPSNKASAFDEKCSARKEHGFNSGMGAIFLKVAGISPLHTDNGLPGAVGLAEEAATPQGHARRWSPSAALGLTAAAFSGVALAALWLRRGRLQRHCGREHESSDLEQMASVPYE